MQWDLERKDINFLNDAVSFAIQQGVFFLPYVTVLCKAFGLVTNNFEEKKLHNVKEKFHDLAPLRKGV